MQQSPEFVCKKPYLCAIGGEGRDLALLMQAARLLGPAVTVVVIARPHSLAGLQVLTNVKVLTNISLAQTWGIAMDSCDVLVPLLSRPCYGHIPLVSAKLLGLPIAATYVHTPMRRMNTRRGVRPYCNVSLLTSMRLPTWREKCSKSVQASRRWPKQAFRWKEMCMADTTGRNILTIPSMTRGVVEHRKISN